MTQPQKDTLSLPLERLEKALTVDAPGREREWAEEVTSALTAIEQREMRQPFVPKDLDQLIRAINGLRHNNHVYVRMTRPDDGAIVRGEYMQSLPPSVLSVLGGSEQGTSVIPLRTAAVWDFDLTTDYAVSGSRVLTLTVER